MSVLLPEFSGNRNDALLPYLDAKPIPTTSSAIGLSDLNSIMVFRPSEFPIPIEIFRGSHCNQNDLYFSIYVCNQFKVLFAVGVKIIVIRQSSQFFHSILFPLCLKSFSTLYILLFSHKLNFLYLSLNNQLASLFIISFLVFSPFLQVYLTTYGLLFYLIFETLPALSSTFQTRGGEKFHN